MKTSVTSRDAMLEALSTGLANGTIKIYDDGAAAPSSPDDAIPGACQTLVEITESGDGVTGLTFETAASGVLAKNTAETWLGTIAISGTAVFFRFIESGGDDTASITQHRLQGTVGLVNADMLVATTSYVANGSNEQRVDYFVIGLPESA